MVDWSVAYYDDAQLRADLSRSSAGSLAALVWDWAVTLDDEVELIWPKSSFCWIKWVFIFVRYFALIIQVCNRSLDYAVSFQYSIDAKSLRIWYICQVLLASATVSGLEIVLMTRVYALYNQARWVLTLFITLIILEIAVVITGIVLTLPDTDFNPLEFTSNLPVSFAYFGIYGLVVQTVIFVMTLVKSVQSRWKTVPLVRRLRQEGTFTYLVLSIFCTIMVIYTLLDVSFGVTAYAWLLTAVSSAGCRLIINLQRFRAEPLQNTSTAIEFTTVFTDTNGQLSSTIQQSFILNEP